MKMKELIEEVELGEGVTLESRPAEKKIIVKGPKGEAERNTLLPGFDVKVEGNKAVISCHNVSKREKVMMGTIKAHIRNMVKGVTEGHSYKLKICSGHFPMSVKVEGNQLIIRNFIGEKHPRAVKIREGAKVSVNGEIVSVESHDKEIAGQVAADIEQLTRRVGFDKRVFQDGLYIIEKDGKKI